MELYDDIQEDEEEKDPQKVHKDLLAKLRPIQKKLHDEAIANGRKNLGNYYNVVKLPKSLCTSAYHRSCLEK